MEQINDSEKAFIEFYNNMATQTTQESGAQFLEIPKPDNLQTGSALTVVTPTQATVQRAKKQVLRKAPVALGKAKSAKTKKKTMRKKQVKRLSNTVVKKKAKTAKLKKKNAGRGVGNAIRKSKLQKKRVQKGGGRKTKKR